MPSGPSVAVTMQYFTAPIAAASRAPATSSSTESRPKRSTPVSNLVDWLQNAQSSGQSPLFAFFSTWIRTSVP